ncbi:MAG: hypothetical protein KDA80_09225 [Planctomycetaceae bacterium]|nr:hypothetical protein [Planctomycetaceae bacterium]
MERRVEQLQKRKSSLLKELAEDAAEIRKLDGSQAEVPHYSQIEDAARLVCRDEIVARPT